MKTLIIRFISLGLCLALAVCFVTSTPDLGESTKQQVISYLSEIQQQKGGPLTPTEVSVGRYLATDDHIHRLKNSKAEVRDNWVSIDVWQVDTKTGHVYVSLRKPSYTITFQGDLSPNSSRGLGITMKECAIGCR